MKEYEFPENRKYIYKQKNGTYHIMKYFHNGGKPIQKYFGSFEDYNEAIKHRDKCIAGNWDESLKHIHPMRDITKNPTKYITKNGNSWVIQRNYKGKKYYYGRFRNLLDAMAERDLLIKYNWDIEKVCECNDDRIAETSIYLNRRME